MASMVAQDNSKDTRARDGIETLPEPEALEKALPPAPHSKPDELLDEALLETFPASDPPASGRME